MTYSEKIKVSTKGFCDVVDITKQVADIVFGSGIQQGIVTLFVNGSTAGVTTIEYESGAVKDFQEMMERLVPQDIDYDHNAKWGDGNGFSHIRASLLGPSLTVPIDNKQMALGTWQQIVVVDFDNRARKREVMVMVLGD